MKTALAVMAAGILCALVAVTRRKARLRDRGFPESRKRKK